MVFGRVPGPRPRTRPKAKAQAPKLQPKARPGPKPGNALDLHDSRHASGIHHLFALDLARLRTPEAVPSLFQVVHGNDAKLSKSSKFANTQCTLAVELNYCCLVDLSWVWLS